VGERKYLQKHFSSPFGREPGEGEMKKAIDYVRRQGEIEAKELRRLGIDLNLAPTVDVLTEIFSPNIGIRSYGKDPDLVAQMAAARIYGMQSNGLSACAKHFPGQGQSPQDAHLDLPVLATAWKEMEAIHLKPFLAAIDAGVDAIMTSHPVYPNLDPAYVPATFSKGIVHHFLRKELGYEGVIVTDDLEMGALKNICSIGESAVRAIEAGHDMVLVCHGREAVLEVHAALTQALKEGRLEREEIELSLDRLEKLKAKRKERFSGSEVFAEPEGKALAAKIAEEGIQINFPHPNPLPEGEGKILPPRPMKWGEGWGEGRFHVIFPRLSELSNRIHIEDAMLNEEAYVRQLFKEQNIKVDIVGLTPSETEIQILATHLKTDAVTVFFCYDAHLDPQTLKVLNLVQEKAGTAVIVLLRNPYDEAFIKKGISSIQAFGFRTVQIKAAVSVIASAAKQSQNTSDCFVVKSTPRNDKET
jgi:beta-N-acetylhexosaminidase